MLRLAMLAAVCVPVLTGVAPRAQGRPELALKAAMDKEVIDGDLKGAIEEYKKVVANAGELVTWGDGRVSPDGRFISYVAYVGTQNLMLHDLVAGTDRSLTGNKD